MCLKLKSGTKPHNELPFYFLAHFTLYDFFQIFVMISEAEAKGKHGECGRL